MKILMFLILTMILSHCKNIDKTLTNLNSSPYGVCYSKISAVEAQNYRLLIIESDLYNKAEIMQLKSGGAKIFGYLSLGEVSRYKWYFPLLQKVGFLGVNENWGSYYLDISKRKTKTILLDQVLPEIVVKGVDGIFLDTIDAVAPYTKRKEFQPDMAELIHEIKKRYDKVKVIQNSGLFLLPETHSSIDAVLVEDVVSEFDFLKSQYSLRAEKEYIKRIKFISASTSKYNLPVFFLEFANSASLRDSISTVLDTYSFPYFISTISLDTLPRLPDNYTNKF